MARLRAALLERRRTGGVRPAERRTIPRRPLADEAPASYPQERFWFLHQLDPASPAYNVRVALALAGPVDPGALERALRTIVVRHEPLRTVFAAPDGRPRQIVLPPPDVPLLAIRDAAGADALRSLAAWLEEPFDLERGPLFRTAVFRRGDDDHLLGLSVHHCVCDFWSLEILLRELAEAYTAAVEGREAALPELPIRYADYALWQRDRDDSRIARDLDFWRTRLSDATPLELPTDRARRGRRALGSEIVQRLLPPGSAAALHSLATAAGATPYMIGLAALAVVLRRYTGQREVAVGTPVAGRTEPELEHLIGCLTNMLIVRVDAERASTFGELLADVRGTVVDALAHQAAPFERLVQEVASGPRADDNPFTRVGYGFAEPTPTEWAMGGLRVRPVSTETDDGAGTGPAADATAGFDLTLVLDEQDGGLRCHWTYARELFDAWTIERLSDHFARVLEALLADADAAVASVPLLDAEERRELVLTANETAAPIRRARLDELVSARAAAAPDATAVACGDETLSYEALERRSNRLAWVLQSLGVGPEKRVAFCLERSTDLVVTMLAILRAGGAYVPLDPGHPSERLAILLADSGAQVVVTSSSASASLPASVATVSLDAAEAELAAAPDTPPPCAAVPENLAYVIYTSGSTGTPKGVAVAHLQAVNVLDWVNESFAVGAGDRLLFVTSPGFDLSVYDVFGVLAAGGTVVVAPDEALREPEHLLTLLAEGAITIWDSAPAALQQLMLLVADGVAYPKSNLRLVLLSGDWIPLPLPGRVRAAFPSASVVALGGATEATIWSNWFPVGGVDPEWASIPYGRPIRNARYYVLDERWEPLPARVPGELYIGGDVLARAYHARPSLTAERFLPDPFSPHPGRRMYRTGDRARRFADGTIEFLGRVDDQVKVRGFRVEVGEVEAALARHPRVDDCAVVARGPAGERALVAYVVTRSEPPAPADLRRYLADVLPDHMIPTSYVMLDALPITENGKCDRARLPDPPAVEAGSTAAAEPRTPTEIAVAEIWRELLEREHVGRDDDFFAIGGHSLLALQVVLRVRSRFGVNVPVRTLLANPTLAAFAAEIAAAGTTDGDRSSPLVVLREGDRQPAFVLVHAVYGDTDCYAELVDALTGHPVYGFEARGPAGGGLSTLVSRYVSELRARGPAPPFVLGGWSLGGKLAFEIAATFAAGGDEAPVLVLVDPTRGATSEEPDEDAEQALLAAFVHEVVTTSGHGAMAEAAELAGDPHRVLADVAERLRGGGADAAPTADQLMSRYELFRSDEAAFLSAEARLARPDGSGVYPGRVHLVEAAGTPTTAATWARLCPRLDVETLPGDHFALLRGDNARRLADVFRRAAAEALREPVPAR